MYPINAKRRTTATNSRFRPWYDEVRKDIYRYCEAMNFEPSPQQRQLLDAVQAAANGNGSRYVAVKSGQGPGKTTVSAIIGGWRLLRVPDTMVVVTAPSMRQCKDVWLSEYRRLLRKADPFMQKIIKVEQTKATVLGQPDWQIRLVTASNPMGAQGLHHPNMTVICEESSGIDREMMEQFEGTVTGGDNLMVAIGNPNLRSCRFFDYFTKEVSRWNTLTFNAEDTPHWIIDPDHTKMMEETYGRDSDVYRVRVLGEFPREDPNSIISQDDILACMALDPMKFVREPRITDPNSVARQFGIDLARFGSDESVIVRRSGNSMLDLKFYSHTDPNDVVEKAFVMQHQAAWKDEDVMYVPDAGGMGQGVLRRFYDAGKRVMEFHNGGRAHNSRQYSNKITEAWFHLADLVKQRKAYLIRDPQLIHQLADRQYRFTKKGQLEVESKKDYIDRGNEHSPDRADAVVMAFYDQVKAAGKSVVRQASGRSVGDVRRGR